MKKPLKLLLFILLFNSTYGVKAQQMFPVAITETGLLLGKYKSADQVRKVLKTTISLTEARGIYALNAIFVDRDKEISRVEVDKFQMSILTDEDTVSILNSGEKLSAEAKNLLGKIKSGSKLIFEGIQAKFSEDMIWNVIILKFDIE